MTTISVGSRITTRWIACVALVTALNAPAYAQHARVRDTLHNLSVSGPGEIRALSETEVCKFCHIPHNAVVAEPLWGQRLSQADYVVPSQRAAGGGSRAVPQPDGSSRLCLSCHDGTVALGEVGGEPETIRMTGAQRLVPGRRGFIGTDLSGGHPVSFVVVEEIGMAAEAQVDMGLRSVAEIEADPDVGLDANGKMQCTTCHDPHSDAYFVEGKVPRFWVKATLEGVCLTCHAVR